MSANFKYIKTAPTVIQLQHNYLLELIIIIFKATTAAKISVPVTKLNALPSVQILAVYLETMVDFSHCHGNIIDNGMWVFDFIYLLIWTR